MYFGDWVLKLLNCIAWRLNSGVGPLTAAAPPSLSYLLDPDLSEKWFFEKPSSGPLVKQYHNKYYPFRDRHDYAMGLWFRKHCNDSQVNSYFAASLGEHLSFQSAQELRQKREERQRWKATH